jgi:threonine/homoserine/homoserine lactone efflux protein
MFFLSLIISGAIIGYFASMPIGPVNLICIRRTLHYGWVFGFLSALGAALGDVLYASISAFGLTAIRQLINGFSTPLQLGGGIFLLVFGLSTFFAPPPPSFQERLNAPVNGNGNGSPKLLRAMASTCMLAVSNPITLGAYAGVFTLLSGLSGDNPSFFYAAFVVIGVFVGSSLWWLTLSTVVGSLHARINDKVVRRINEFSGLLIMVCGILVLAHLAGVPFLNFHPGRDTVAPLLMRVTG